MGSHGMLMISKVVEGCQYMKVNASSVQEYVLKIGREIKSQTIESEADAPQGLHPLPSPSFSVTRMLEQSRWLTFANYAIHVPEPKNNRIWTTRRSTELVTYIVSIAFSFVMRSCNSVRSLLPNAGIVDVCASLDANDPADLSLNMVNGWLIGVVNNRICLSLMVV